MEVKWINHQSKEILLVDYRGAQNEDEMINVLMQEIEIEKKASSKILVLADFTGTLTTPKYMDTVKKLGKEVRIEKVEKTALIGMSGAKKIVLKGYILFTGEKQMKIFDTDDDAKLWLAS